MLIGVVVEVISSIKMNNQEKKDATHLVDTLAEIMMRMDENHDGKITVTEFEALLLQPESIEVLTKAGVDVEVLGHLKGHIFGYDEMTILTWHELCTAILKLRKSNTACNADCAQIKQLIESNQRTLERYP